MDYYVIGPDGNKYGPASVQTLQQWSQEGRIGAQSMLEDAATGQQLQASAVPGLFATAAPPQPTATPQYASAPGSSYATQSSYVHQESAAPLMGIIVRCVIALVFFFVLNGIGLFFSGYAMYYAVQLKSAGSKYGTIALVIAGCTLGAIGIGWMIKLGGM